MESVYHISCVGSWNYSRSYNCSSGVYLADAGDWCHCSQRVLLISSYVARTRYWNPQSSKGTIVVPHFCYTNWADDFQSLSTFPLIPVDRYFRGVPSTIRVRGGFLMVCLLTIFAWPTWYRLQQPMFQREAIRLEFDDMTYTSGEKSGSAIKVSVGG